MNFPYTAVHGWWCRVLVFCTTCILVPLTPFFLLYFTQFFWPAGALGFCEVFSFPACPSPMLGSDVSGAAVTTNYQPPPLLRNQECNPFLPLILSKMLFSHIGWKSKKHPCILSFPN